MLLVESLLISLLLVGMSIRRGNWHTLHPSDLHCRRMAQGRWGWTENISSHDLASLLRNSYFKGVLFDYLKNTSSLALQLMQLIFFTVDHHEYRRTPSTSGQAIKIVKLDSQVQAPSYRDFW